MGVTPSYFPDPRGQRNSFFFCWYLDSLQTPSNLTSFLFIYEYLIEIFFPSEHSTFTTKNIINYCETYI